MLAAGDFSALLQLALTALALLFGALLAVRKAASRYFVVDAAFDPGDDHRMSIGAGEEPGDGCSCAVCGRPAAKKCSRCKCVFYCSQSCQTNHWENHKLKCKQARLSDKVGNVCSKDDAWQRRKSSGFSAISLVPARGRGTGKVLQEPKKILFPYEEFVNLFKWDNPGFRPCGLLNCGNSCFANVVLQCLTCTRPLIAFLLERDHSRVCIRKDDWCFLCELQLHVQRSRENLHPFSPVNILSRLPNIGGNLGYGRQEDAHEFMRFAIDTMQSVCLDEFGGEKALDSSTQKTTLIHHIFGGHLQSQVICAKCNKISNRYENMMDLTVEIQGDAESLEECLDQFTMKEWLEGDNMYKCDGCNDYVTAWKRLTIHQAPNVLTIALKRFQSGRFGKLNKRVTFPENLDLTPYMSGNGDGTDLYTLYAVVVHLDMLNASFFGHYICYTKDYQGCWFRIDDSKVTSVEVEEVLAQGAYMLLYRRKNARGEPYIKLAEAPSKKHLVVDPVASNISMATESVNVDRVPCNAGSRSKFVQCVVSNNVSLPGHERDLPIEGNPMEGTESADMIEIKSDCVPNENGFGPIPLGPKDLEDINLRSSDMPESISSLEPMQSDSSIEAQIAGNEETCVGSVANVCMEGDTGSREIDLEQVGAAHCPLYPANEGIRIPSCWEKGSVSKPLFARGFLDRPARKEPASRKEIIQRGKCGVSSLSPKVNGHVNSHVGAGFTSPGALEDSTSPRSQSSNGNYDGALTEVNGQGLIGTALANGTCINGRCWFDSTVQDC